METINKLKILSESSQYDLACACGTNDTDRRKKSEDGKWIYPVTLPNGGQSIMLVMGYTTTSLISSVH